MVSLRNTAEGYGWLAIASHWLMAAGVIFLLASGFYMGELSYVDPWYVLLPELHVGIGVGTLALLTIRLPLRVLDRTPGMPGSRVRLLAARSGHWLLYALTAAVLFSGYLFLSADGRPIQVFDLFHLPAVPWSIDQRDTLFARVHELGSWALVALTAGHALAACKHQFVDRDATLTRILRPSRQCRNRIR